MSYANTTRWSLLVGAALLTSLFVYACGITGRLETDVTVPVPGVGTVHVSTEMTVDGQKTITAEGAPLANKCVETTFRGADGAVTGSSVTQAGGNGSATGQVPPGSVSYEAVVVDCPEEEEGGGDRGGEMANSCLQIGGFDKKAALGGRLLDFAQVEPVLVFGGPLVADPTPGEWSLCYSLLVRAASLEEAKSIARPVITAGIASKVPEAVTVLKFSSMTADASGARLLDALPGDFVQWSLDFNHGAFYADLFTNTIRHRRNGWDIVETVIPSSAIDSGVLPGVEYTNTGEVDYQVDYLSEPLSSAFTYSYSN